MSSPSTQPRILLVTSRADAGGGPRHVLQMIQGLSTSCEIFVASPPDRPYGILFLKEVGEEHFFHLPHRSFSLKAVFSLAAFVRRHRVQLIHSVGHGAGIYARLAALMAHVPCLHAFHGLHWRQRSFFSRIVYFGIEGFLGLLSTRLVSVSEDERQDILRFHAAPSSRLSMIPNGVEIPTADLLRPPDFAGPLRVISMTRFDYQKNTSGIADVMAVLAERGCLGQFEFHLLGDGEGREAFRVYAEKKGVMAALSVHGHVARPAELFAGAFAYLTISRWEGLPYALLEAMSWGIPIVASRVSGHNDCIHPGENGFLFELSDPAQAADCLLELRDRALWEKYSAKARLICEEGYRVESMLEAYHALYLQLLSSKGKPL